MTTVGLCFDCDALVRFEGLADASPSRCPLNVNQEHRAVCQWFALCGDPATTTIPHPILGDVPTCAPCKERYEST